MPPVSAKQNRYIQAAASRGEQWAIDYLRKWKRETTHKQRQQQLRVLKKS